LKKNLQSTIEQKFRDKLLELPEGAERRGNEAWVIASPQFVRKEGQRVTWISQVRLEHGAYKTVYTALAPTTGSYPSGTLPGIISGSPGTIFPTAFTGGSVPVYSTGVISASSPGQVPYSGQPFSGIYGSYYTPQLIPRDLLIETGRTIFEVEWSVVVTSTEKLKDPRIEDIRLIQALWY